MKSYKDLFHLPEDLIYLNCSYMAPLLKTVEEAGIEAVKKRRNPLNYHPDDFFTDVRQCKTEFAKLINAPVEDIVLVPSVSYGLANVAHNITCGPGKTIVVAAEQFPSNYYPWERVAQEGGGSVKCVEPGEKNDREAGWNRNILDAINENTVCVAIAHTHWADGTKFDLKAIRKKTQDFGALLVVDGTQSVGALPFNLEEFMPDALVCAGYKWLMGPYALGFAYYGSYFDDARPVEENWINRKNSENFAGLVNYKSEYQPGKARFGVGEHSNFTLVPMLLAAIKEVNSLTPEFIQQYTGEIISEPLSRLKEAGFGVASPEWRGNHLFGIRMTPHADVNAIKETFSKDKIVVSWRGDSLRVSPNVYNTASDMRRITDHLLVSIREKAG